VSSAPSGSISISPVSFHRGGAVVVMSLYNRRGHQVVNDDRHRTRTQVLMSAGAFTGDVELLPQPLDLLWAERVGSASVTAKFQDRHVRLAQVPLLQPRTQGTH
jgi:hypothetical protein